MAERVVKSKGRVSSRTKVSDVPIDKMIETLQALGFKLTPPSGEGDRAKQEASLEKLGAKSKRKVEAPKAEEMLTYVLRCQHNLGGVVYGPGRITLPMSDEAIYRTLVHQDQYSVNQSMDSNSVNPYTQSFLIGVGNRNSYRKIAVREEDLQNAENFAPSFTVGAVDAAGYRENVSRDGTF